MSEVVVEFVAGPRCGETEIVDRRSSPLPPLALDLPTTSPRDTTGSVVYRRRGDAPDPGSARWLYDHSTADQCIRAGIWTSPAPRTRR